MNGLVAYVTIPRELDKNNHWMDGDRHAYLLVCNLVKPWISEEDDYTFVKDSTSPSHKVIWWEIVTAEGYDTIKFTMEDLLAPGDYRMIANGTIKEAILESSSECEADQD